MREKLCFLLLAALLLSGILLFAFGLREAVHVKEEMRGIRVQIECLNIYMEKIAP